MTKVLTASVRITGKRSEEDVDSNIVLGGWTPVVWHTMPAFAYPAIALPAIALPGLRSLVMTKECRAWEKKRGFAECEREMPSEL